MKRVERMIAANKHTLFSAGWPEVGWLFGLDAPELGPSGEIIPRAPADSITTRNQAGELRGRARMVAAFEQENAGREAAEIRERKMLTETASSAKLAPVKSQLDNLLSRFNRLIKEPGNKTELADYLGASLASVSRWVSGKREPGGQTQLKMLHWVERHERQQKQSPGSVPPPPGRKTQVRKSDHEKQTQVRKME